MPKRKRKPVGGVYQLHLFVAEEVRLRVGKLGTFDFPAGRYVYTGSALNGLEQRLARHLRRRKKMHWHIDYLLRYARIEWIDTVRTSRRRECELNGRAMDAPGARILAKGFGSSDCLCPAHLVYLGTGSGAGSRYPVRPSRIPSAARPDSTKGGRRESIHRRESRGNAEGQGSSG
jgi:Uri superfamily endonuclease